MIVRRLTRSRTPAANQTRADRNTAGRRVLDGVPKQVDENVSKMRRVRADAWQRYRNRNRQLERPLAEERLELTRDGEHEGPERHHFTRDLEPASRYPGNVQDLIDEMSEMRRRCGDAVDRTN